MSRADLSLWTIFRLPLLAAGLSLSGLATALFFDGPGDGLASALLSGVPVLTVWALIRRRR
ncbi:hypothetical protein E4M02_00220 [Brevundimonas sp. S30B]|uniref:hypothetical protein n=1 Tax=unclassified Brevundimonas TaxID=2622653 RepID=UPI0010725D5F|nr:MULTISPECIES: hypothetical protein [unclassified Brevundimonas]QBX37648.1 hypothetical protein E4M01_07600 [Brevundimonas sp. MF30-B]TFW03559.1 hypothetical protein E4M02_00220 [Brevundimonas sp. S30B]